MVNQRIPNPRLEVQILHCPQTPGNSREEQTGADETLFHNLALVLWSSHISKPGETDCHSKYISDPL